MNGGKNNRIHFISVVKIKQNKRGIITLKAKFFFCSVYVFLVIITP